MGVLSTATQVILEQSAACQGLERAIRHHRPTTISRCLTHLLWLPRFDLVRAYHLHWVRPLGLGLLTGARATLGYSTLEHFLGELEALRVAAPLGDALARCYLAVWPLPSEGAFFYLDNRRKVRYSSYPIAAGKISASERILGATTQLFLHDEAGHSLHMHSGPGDDHLTRTLLPLVQHVVTVVGRTQVRGIVADQEMRSVSLFLALQASELGFVTLSRTPIPARETAYEVDGLFLPYRRDPETGVLTHWVAPAHTRLWDRTTGLSFLAAVTLVVDCRAGLPGRLIPVLHNLRDPEMPVEFPHRLYVGRWEGQERRFRDMRACQNLDANYGQKKRAVPNRTQARHREVLRRRLCTQEKQVATAQRQVREATARIAALAQAAQQHQLDNQAAVAALRRASRAVTTAKQRERLLVQAERLSARNQVQQVRFRERGRRLRGQRRTWQQTLQARQTKQKKVAQALEQLEERPLYDFDLEKDDLMTYLRMAGENAHHFVQEQYFAGTLLEKTDEATMARVVYNQPGWVQRQGQYLQVRLQAYSDPKVQAAVTQACQRVNQAQVNLPSGHRLRMEVSVKILDW